MKTLSAADALGPAFRRVREVMFAPFRLGFFLKIALVAALTQPSFYSLTVSYPMQGAQTAAGAAARHSGQLNFVSADPASVGSSGAAGSVAVLVIFAVIALIGLLIWLVMAYLLSRLRFTLFDLVVYKRGHVRESWGKYARQAWRYFGVMLLASLAFLVAAAATVGPFFVRMVKHFKDIPGGSGANANPWPFLAQMLPMIGVFLLLGLAWIVVDAVLQDFILPPMAIEDAPIEGAFGRFFALVKADAGSIAVYILLRFVVAVGISWVLMMGVFLALLLLGLGGAVVGVGLFHAMWSGGLGLRVVFVLIAAVLVLVVLALYLVAIIAVYGTAAVFKQSYAAYFFGSRYRELGNRLEPPEDELAGVRMEPPLPPLPSLGEPPPVY